MKSTCFHLSLFLKHLRIKNQFKLNSEKLKLATFVQCAPLKLTCFHFSLFSKAAFLHCLLQWHKMHYVPKCTFLQSFYVYSFLGNKNQITFILFFEYCLFRSNRNIIKIHSELSSDEAEKMLSPRTVHAVHIGSTCHSFFLISLIFSLF